MNRSPEFLTELASDYYLEGLSQAEIGRKYKISRPTVSHLLKLSRARGIVEIRINSGARFSQALEERLGRDYGLNRVIVVPTQSDHALTLNRTALEGAEYLSSLLFDRIKIGISWGTALYHLIRQLPRHATVDSQVVQLTGGLGASALYYDGSELARLLAEKINGQSFPFLAPLLVQSPELKVMLCSDPRISETLEKAASLDLALVGLSSNRPQDSAVVQAGFLTVPEAEELEGQGAWGHLCGYHYDRRGSIMNLPINERVVGIPFSGFLRIPRRIAVACGRQKAKAIYAALRGGLVTDLVTDEQAALQILSLGAPED
ncbi:MAG: sugar-binding transcriptional regulator [Spirochaetales bacterium]|jgi:DNA-binding transcriptional regulator LsrR (DeoR family)|nr:sugar-binding transcriptional regulator [Spirochaetales bacterium]